MGKVLRAMPKTGKVIVENVNVVARHTKPSGQGQPGGIIRSEGAIFASKVMLYCEKCNKATRISYKVAADGKKVRVCKHLSLIHISPRPLQWRSCQMWHEQLAECFSF